MTLSLLTYKALTTEPADVRTLAERLDADARDLDRVLTGLEAAGLIERRPEGFARVRREAVR